MFRLIFVLLAFVAGLVFATKAVNFVYEKRDEGTFAGVTIKTPRGLLALVRMRFAISVDAPLLENSSRLQLGY